MDTEQQDTKKITAGKKNNKIIVNPPEKPPIKNVNERFKDALPKHTVVIEKKIKLVLQAKANAAELPEQALIQVFTRGYKTLPLNSALTREQYAMNRVNSFIAGGLAMQEDFDLLPIDEKFVRLGMKGTGGARRPHIKREKSPYNNKVVYHVVDSKGVVKHSTSDEGEAKQHLAQKYNSYMGEAKQMKGEDPCWKGYHMVGKKIKAGREVPNCVPKNEEVEDKIKTSLREASPAFDTIRNRTAEREKRRSDQEADSSSRHHERMQAMADRGVQSHMHKQKHFDRMFKAAADSYVKRTKDDSKDPDISAMHRVLRNRVKNYKRGDSVKEANEATSVAVRMQRALEKIKADRERKERLAAPYVKSVFGKKDDKPEPKKD